MIGYLVLEFRTSERRHWELCDTYRTSEFEFVYGFRKGVGHCFCHLSGTGTMIRYRSKESTGGAKFEHSARLMRTKQRK